RRKKLLRGAEELRVVRVAAQASRDPQNLHWALRLLGEEELGDELDLVRERAVPVRERHVPVDAESRAVDGRLDPQADAASARRVLDRVGDGPGQDEGLRDALDRELTADRDLVARAADFRRLEGELRMALGVEEVGRLQM